MQEKQLLYYQNIKCKPCSINLASVESWGEAQSYTFPAFSLWIVSSRSVPAQEPAKCPGRDTCLTFHWDLLPGSCSNCFLGVAGTPTATAFPSAFPKCLHLPDTTHDVSLSWMHPGVCKSDKSVPEGRCIEKVSTHLAFLLYLPRPSLKSSHALSFTVVSKSMPLGTLVQWHSSSETRFTKAGLLFFFWHLLRIQKNVSLFLCWLVRTKWIPTGS